MSQDFPPFSDSISQDSFDEQPVSEVRTSMYRCPDISVWVARIFFLIIDLTQWLLYDAIGPICRRRSRPISFLNLPLSHWRIYATSMLMIEKNQLHFGMVAKSEHIPAERPMIALSPLHPGASPKGESVHTGGIVFDFLEKQPFVDTVKIVTMDTVPLKTIEPTGTISVILHIGQMFRDGWDGKLKDANTSLHIEADNDTRTGRLTRLQC